MTLVTSTPRSSTAADHDQTAAVFDFDCIYSHDIQRKRQKRWHDGFLRFHTFNRRVMVYDVPRNFIGDTHLRDADTLQDGDELQLDRGVLVEVGESRGVSRQDVTPLFERRRPPPPLQRTAGDEAAPPPPLPPPPRPIHSSPPSISATLLKPKPLNVVLGPRRGLQGRAVLAKYSPYEQSKSPETNVQISETERPAKRARVEERRRGPPAPRRNTEQRFEIRKASSLLPGDRSDQPIDIIEAAPPRRSHALGKTSAPAPIRNRQNRSATNESAPSQDSVPDQPLGNGSRPSPAPSKDRLTSKLKVSATKRPKLMCLSTSNSAEKRDAYPARPRDQTVPARRAPLRISAMDHSSSPTSGNFTVMDFPTSQDFFARHTQTPLPMGRTLDELDRELLQGSPELPEPQPVPKAAPQLAPLPKSASAPSVPSIDPPTANPAAPQAPGPAPAQQSSTYKTTKSVAAPSTTLPPAARPQPPPAPPAPPAPTLALPSAAPSDPPNQVLRPRKSPLKKAHTAPTQSTLAQQPTDTSTASATVVGSQKKASIPPRESGAAPTRTSTTSATSTSAPTTALPASQPASSTTTEADLGPWSRTAFDLFGFVPPPAGTGDKHAHELRRLKQRATAIRGSVRGMMREYCD